MSGGECTPVFSIAWFIGRIGELQILYCRRLVYAK